MKSQKNQPGATAIVVVFVFGMISLLLVLSLSKTAYWESIRGRTANRSIQAHYLAQSGLEEAIYQIKRAKADPDDGIEIPATLTFDALPGEVATVTVQEDASNNQIAIVSTGQHESIDGKRYVRTITAVVRDTTLSPKFDYVIQSGAGGIELAGNTRIIGDVFSQSFIKATSNAASPDGTCRNNSSAVIGAAWAVDRIHVTDKAEETDHPNVGLCVEGTAISHNLNYCQVSGDIYYADYHSLVDCPYQNGNLYTYGEYPKIGSEPVYPITPDEIEIFRNALSSKPTLPSHEPADGEQLGNITIDGSLTIKSGYDIYITGPVLVKGDVFFESNSSIQLDPSIIDVGQILIAEGRITSAANMAQGTNGSAYLLLVSLYDSDPSSESIDNVCQETNVPAIEVASNTNSILLYAPNGCIDFSANPGFQGAIVGAGVKMNSNSQIGYDTGLIGAMFGLTQEGGWQIISFKES